MRAAVEDLPTNRVSTVPDPCPTRSVRPPCIIGSSIYNEVDGALDLAASSLDGVRLRVVAALRCGSLQTGQKTRPAILIKRSAPGVRTGPSHQRLKAQATDPYAWLPAKPYGLLDVPPGPRSACRVCGWWLFTRLSIRLPVPVNPVAVAVMAATLCSRSAGG